MRKQISVILVLFALLIFILPITHVSAVGIVPDYEKISLFNAPETYPADEPFYIEHGILVTEPRNLPLTDFRITVINSRGLPLEPQPQGVLRLIKVDVEEYKWAFVETRLYDFPDGIPAGIYTITGFWFEPVPGTRDSELFLRVYNTITFTQ